MKLLTISATAGRKTQHPTEQFGNYLNSVTLVAELAAGDDEFACTKKLQELADCLVEEEKRRVRQMILAPYQPKRTAQAATQSTADLLAERHAGRRIAEQALNLPAGSMGGN